MSNRNPDGTFAKGISGNPAGKAKGTRGALARALDELVAADASALLAKTVDLAKDGDVSALRLLLGRAWPVPKGRSIEDFALPPINTLADTVPAMNAIASAVTTGALTIEDARGLSEVIDTFRKTYELIEVDRRLTTLEKRAAAYAQAQAD